MADETVETVDRILPAAVPLLLLLGFREEEDDGGGNHRTGAVRTVLWSVMCRTSLTET